MIVINHLSTPFINNCHQPSSTVINDGCQLTSKTCYHLQRLSATIIINNRTTATTTIINDQGEPWLTTETPTDGSPWEPPQDVLLKLLAGQWLRPQGDRVT